MMSQAVCDLVPLLEKQENLAGHHPAAPPPRPHPRTFLDDRIRRILERRVRQWQAMNRPERDISFVRRRSRVS